jgi:hypothetical protein
MKNVLRALVFLTIILPVTAFSQNKIVTNTDSLNAYEKTADFYSIIEAKSKASLLAKKFGADEHSQKELYELIYDQNTELSRLRVKYAGSGVLQEKYTTLLSRQDSLLNLFLEKLNNKKFIQDKLRLVKNLSKEKQSKIYSDFLSIAKEKHLDACESLLIALRQNTNDTSVYSRLYKNEIKFNAEASFTNYLISNQLPQIALVYIRPVLFRQQNEIFTVYYANNNPDVTNKMIYGITNKYANRLDSILFLKHISVPLTLFGTALKMDTGLSLSKQQRDQLLTECINYKKARLAFTDSDPSGIFDYTSQEHLRLPQILNKDQYMAVLSAKNIKGAERNMEDAWNQIMHYALTVGPDTTNIKKEIMAYYLKRLVANEFYYDNIIEQKKQKAEINKDRPNLIKKLESAVRHADDDKNMQKAAGLKW